VKGNEMSKKIWELNRDHERRNALLGIVGVKYTGGLIRFGMLAANRLKLLIDEQFINPSARHNDGPTAQEFLKFMERWPALRAGGYATHPERSDCRVSIDTLEFDGFNFEVEDLATLRGEFLSFASKTKDVQSEFQYLRAFWD
jgi:hypothetical protein